MTIDDRELDRRLHALTREAEPAPGGWRSIERRMGLRRRIPAAATAAAAVLAVGALVVFRLAPEAGGGPEMRRLVAAEVTAMRAAAPGQRAVAQLDSPEALMRAWQDNRDAIAELEAALARDPDNELLLEFLREARLRQARLIGQGITTHERSMNL